MTWLPWIAWIWSNIALLGCGAGLVALWWYWSRLRMFGIPVWMLLGAVIFLTGLGWGEKRYSDGIDSADTILRQKMAEAQRRAAAKDAELKATRDEIERVKREKDRKVKEANNIAEANLHKAQEAAQRAQEAESDGRSDAEIIADLDARLEAANGLIADLNAQLGDRSSVPDCKPKYITKTIRRDCQAYVWPKGVTDALKERR